MATLFIEYQTMVRQAYEGKRTNNTLPYGLMLPTPAKLKEECLKQCTAGVSRQDENIIRDFCGNLNASKNCHDLLVRMEADKFKPLLNFLNGKSANTERKNIELLAWLIDFPGRPWVQGKTYNEFEPTVSNNPDADTSKADDDIIDKDLPKIPTDIVKAKPLPLVNNQSVINNSPKRTRFSTKKFVRTGLLSLALVTGGSWLWHIWPQTAGGCMYWKEDHYQPISCNEKIPDVMVIALDSLRVKTFQKITRPDTITHLSIGKIWYAKIAGRLEYYTAGGSHPMVYDYQLKPITKYIIDKYILSGMVPK